MSLHRILIVSMGLALAVALAVPAEAASKRKKRHGRTAGVPMQAMQQYGAPAWGGGASGSGPLYNGQDYLGTDPDPNIRFQILRDLSLRYGSGSE